MTEDQINSLNYLTAVLLVVIQFIFLEIWEGRRK